jgi:Zn ribbon nucleic-acid-binding protein
MVDKVNQQVKQKIHHSLGKASAEFEPKETEYFFITKRNHPRGRLQNNYKKRERFPTIVMEYEKQELEDLLALEKPRKKKDISQVECRECKRLGHYSWDYPDKEKNKEIKKRSYVINGGQKNHAQDKCLNHREPGHYAMNGPERYNGKDVSLVTCYKCGDKGHYANKCPGKHFRAPVNKDN